MNRMISLVYTLALGSFLLSTPLQARDERDDRKENRGKDRPREERGREDRKNWDNASPRRWDGGDQSRSKWEGRGAENRKREDNSQRRWDGGDQGRPTWEGRQRDQLEHRERRDQRSNAARWQEDNTRKKLEQFLQDHPQQRRRYDEGQHKERFRKRPRDDKNQAQDSWKYNETKAVDLSRGIKERFYRHHPDRRQRWFNRNFWATRKYHPNYYNYNYNWWAAATPRVLSSWLGWQSQPYYYSYSQGKWGPSYYSFSDYNNHTLIIDNFYSANQEWLPLGVFALIDATTSADPNIYMQLAINRDGYIAGTFYNSLTDQTYVLEGLVQQSTQRAVWKIDNRLDSPIFETGIYNLSNPQQPVRLYLPDGSIKNVLMVRLDEAY